MITNDDEITPIEKHGNIYFKRDDLFLPYDDIPINGLKVRQVRKLIERDLEYIRNECDNQIITHNSSVSIQGVIVAKVAKEYGINVNVYCGVKDLEKNVSTRLMKSLGAELDNTTVKVYFDKNFEYVLSNLKRNGVKFYDIGFGYHYVHSKKLMFECAENQCKNIPSSIKNVIISTGSGLSTSAIISGIKKYCPNVKTVYSIQNCGYDRKNIILNTLNLENDIFRTHDVGIDIKFYSADYEYRQKVKCNVSNNFDLDLIYESKAFTFYKNNINLSTDDVLYWIVGNSNKVREL